MKYSILKDREEVIPNAKSSNETLYSRFRIISRKLDYLHSELSVEDIMVHQLKNELATGTAPFLLKIGKFNTKRSKLQI